MLLQEKEVLDIANVNNKFIIINFKILFWKPYIINQKPFTYLKNSIFTIELII